ERLHDRGAVARGASAGREQRRRARPDGAGPPGRAGLRCLFAPARVRPTRHPRRRHLRPRRGDPLAARGRSRTRPAGALSHAFLLFLTTFVASAVEAVEALTIVLAVGVVRGWRSTLLGVGAAAVVLAAIVAALGPALDAIPIDTLRFVVGALLLAFGLQWL